LSATLPCTRQSLFSQAFCAAGAGMTAISGAISGGAMSDAEFSALFTCCCPPLPSLSPTRSRTVSPTEPPPLPRPFVFCFVTFPPSAVLFFTSLQSLQLLRCPSVSLPALRASGAGATTISGAFRGGAVAGAEFLALCICYCPPLSSMLVLGPCLLSITHAVPSSSSRFF